MGSGMVGMARWGLWVFTAGIFAWIFPNLTSDPPNVPNAITDVVIVIGGVLAAVGLPRAVEGFGTGLLRTGLVIVALCQFTQNLVTTTRGLDAGNAAPVVVVMLASIAVGWGAKKWQEYEWDSSATPWLAGGFAGFAFEPVYYLTLGLVTGNTFWAFFPGAVLVAGGGLLCAWAFRPDGDDVAPAESAAPAPKTKARRSRS